LPLLSVLALVTICIAKATAAPIMVGASEIDPGDQSLEAPIVAPNLRRILDTDFDFTALPSNKSYLPDFLPQKENKARNHINLANAINPQQINSASPSIILEERRYWLEASSLSATQESAAADSSESALTIPMPGDMPEITAREAELVLQMRHAALDAYDSLSGVRQTVSYAHDSISQLLPSAATDAMSFAPPTSMRANRSDDSIATGMIRRFTAIWEFIRDYSWTILLMALIWVTLSQVLRKS
jgi:hypothetical protein